MNRMDAATGPVTILFTLDCECGDSCDAVVFVVSMLEEHSTRF